MRVQREPWGTSQAGEPVELFTLENGGLRARFASLGATLVSLEVPDREGERADVVLGFDTLAEYESAQTPYFGGIVGRCANRIAGARFTLDGREFVLPANEGRNHLHGGVRGFDRRVWRAAIDARRAAVRFERLSQNGEEGYPGNLQVAVEYALEKDKLITTSEASADAPTIVNLTQHTYFNLAGTGTILDHRLRVRAERILEVDRELVPTGELLDVSGTPFDFGEDRFIGARIGELVNTPPRGYDVCYALPTDGVTGRWFACSLCDPVSKRELQIETGDPGLQLYTGNHLNDLRGKGGRVYPRFSGVCLETQHFPDAIHHPHFPSVVLRPGELRKSLTVWRFSAE